MISSTLAVCRKAVHRTLSVSARSAAGSFTPGTSRLPGATDSVRGLVRLPGVSQRSLTALAGLVACFSAPQRGVGFTVLALATWRRLTDGCAIQMATRDSIGQITLPPDSLGKSWSTASSWSKCLVATCCRAKMSITRTVSGTTIALTTWSYGLLISQRARELPRRHIVQRAPVTSLSTGVSGG